MANNHYLIAKNLRRHGIDVELILNYRDFGMSFPQWEEGYINNLDPYNVSNEDFNGYFDLPEWIKIWNNPSFIDPSSIMSFFKMIEKYDLLQLAPPGVIYAQFSRKPFIIHESGWLRKFPFQNNTEQKLARRGYKNAEYIVMTNPDCYKILDNLPHKKTLFIPFIVPNRHRTYIEDVDIGFKKNSNNLNVFSPSRIKFEVKGNDRLIKGFSKYIESGYMGKLILTRWGESEDLLFADHLISKLEIGRYVKWVNPVSKPILNRRFLRSDVVADQFILGSYGTSAIEAMSFKKPVLMYLSEKWNDKYYGETAPVVNAKTTEDIFNELIKLTDYNYRRRIGKKSKRYVYKHHNEDKITRQYIKLYEEVLS